MFTEIFKSAKPVVVAVTMLSLSACVGMELDRAKGVDLDGAGAYDAALYKEYLLLSEMEFNEGDYEDSDVFARRALAAAEGNPGGPEELDARAIPGEHRGALAEARRRLVEALDAGAIGRLPEASARAVASFDCWMQEAEENLQPADIAWCRDRFEAALAQIEQPAPAPAQISFANVTVYFAFDSAELSGETVAALVDAANLTDEIGASTVTISGYADRSGSEAYNMALSQRRAEAVAAELRNLLGTDEPPFTLEAFGETNNKVRTPDGVKEAKNRRVKIEIRQ